MRLTSAISAIRSRRPLEAMLTFITSSSDWNAPETRRAAPSAPSLQNAGGADCVLSLQRRDQCGAINS